MFNLAVLSFSLATAALLLGCASEKPAVEEESLKDAMRRPEPIITTNTQEIPSPVVNSPVTGGTLPLVYIVESDATVSVVDETTGLTLAVAAVEGGNILAVNENGVIAGKTTLLKSTLEPSHRYAIYVNSSVRGEFRTTVVRPQPQHRKKENP